METLLRTFQAEPAWGWAGLAAALLAVEVVTGSGWLLWAAASAGATGLAAAFGLDFPATLLVFALLTLASTLLARRYIPKRVTAEGQDINDNVARLVGHEGATVGAFRKGTGRVFIDGKEWAATLDEGETLEIGASVVVTRVDGARVWVRRA